MNEAAVLIFGADPMRVALTRQEIVTGIIGKTGEEEMRLTRIAAGDLRKDPAMLADATRATGFFPGARVVLVEEATDALARLIAPVLDDWRAGDAAVVVTAGALKKGSSLRKLFERKPGRRAIGLYDDPPSRASIEAELKRAGLGQVTGEALAELVALAGQIGPGDLRQLTEKLALYKLGDSEPLSPADIAALAPASTEAGLDEVLMAAAEGRPADISPILVRLQAQGVGPVGLCIAATRHFRALFAAAADPAGPRQGITRLRPPVYFKARDRMVRQAERWGSDRLERALELLIDTDLQLRSASRAPQMALMERALLRLAVIGAKANV
ncbi:MAG TPA: DNA polymerase III subunit delta [Aliiroseovarius sp.]|nr:DNA polymerase III subunit delta [Aliiroseovarius sp.]